MTEIINSKRYDLEARTLEFARQTRAFLKSIKMTANNFEDCKQLMRSSGSIGANYIEANEALSRKDFMMRIKICRKEAKETCYWLNLIDTGDLLEDMRKLLLQEATELMKIFGAILEKSQTFLSKV